MYITICGRFCTDEGIAAGYDNRILAKDTANWGVQIAGMIFQTRSNALSKSLMRLTLLFSAQLYYVGDAFTTDERNIPRKFREHSV